LAPALLKEKNEARRLAGWPVQAECFPGSYPLAAAGFIPVLNSQKKSGAPFFISRAGINPAAATRPIRLSTTKRLRELSPSTLNKIKKIWCPVFHLSDGDKSSNRFAPRPAAGFIAVLPQQKNLVPRFQFRRDGDKPSGWSTTRNQERKNRKRSEESSRPRGLSPPPNSQKFKNLVPRFSISRAAINPAVDCALTVGRFRLL
jgi:hypothetical protein